MKILVAMSGGVDSSVVMHKLAEEGHDLIGVMMKLWTDPLAPAVRRALPTKCCSVEHVQRARNVCASLDIPFFVMNLEEEFRRDVVEPFISDYRNGLTPNPCINCNRTVKFGHMMEKMRELGCEKLATGHYARIAEERSSDGSSRMLLLEAADEAKDQSYYLYGLSQEQLRNVLFPLGSLRKSEVYALAEKFRIGVHDDYRESQDLCFFPEKEPEAFLRRYITDIPAGPIREENGDLVGSHDGLAFYTVGQRRGLRIGGRKIPLYITRKEQKSNTIYVAPSGAELKFKVKAESLRWVTNAPPEHHKISFQARFRSLGEKHIGTFERSGDRATFACKDGVRGAAPGQSVVFYRGQEVLGGGVIAA